MMAMSSPRAGILSLLPTAMIAAARVSCCLLRMTVSPFVLVAVRLVGTGPATPRLAVAWPSHRQLPDPAAAGLNSVATPRTAAPGVSMTAAAAPTARTFMPIGGSPQRIVELGQAQEVAAL